MHEKRRLLASDNRGAAFISVLVAVLFIGVIAAIVMTASHSNLENTKVTKDSSDNFYEDEKAVDELKDSLRSLAGEAVTEAYKKWLKTYSLTPVDKQSSEFNRLFSEAFEEKIKEYFDTGDPSITEFKDYKELMYSLSDDPNVTTDAATHTPTYSVDDETGLITISGIVITLKDETKGVTTISTDLTLAAKRPEINIGLARKANMNVKDYILIADGNIKFTGGLNQMTIGNIYGGAGISMGNSVTKLYANKLITRKGIKTWDNATVTISGNDEYLFHDGSLSEIWADNILLDEGGGTMNVQGACYIADDLSVNSEGSTFKLTSKKSSYYGYGSAATSDDASASSSITINAKNVKIDLSLASRVWLAGKSYIEIPSIWGFKKGEESPFNSEESIVTSTYMQGESISYRPVQSAYLLPGGCIVGIYHNPMTKAEYDSIVSVSNVNDPAETTGKHYIDISRSGAVSKINLERYLDSSKPYYKVEVQYGTTKENILVYLYMNFANPDLAASYFRNYATQYGQFIDAQMEWAKSGEDKDAYIKLDTTGSTTDAENGMIKLDKSKVLSTGNIITYDSTGYKLYESNANFYSQEVSNMRNDRTGDYNNLCATLNKSQAGSLVKDLTESLVVREYFMGEDSEIDNKAFKIVEDGVDTTFSVDGSTEERVAYIVGASDDVWIMSDGIYYGTTGSGPSAGHGSTKDDVGSVNAGIIISDGDVHVKCGSFWGLIIAGGDIIIDQDCDLRASTEYIAKLIEDNEIVSPYFGVEGTNTTGGLANQMKNYVDIEYKDWKKD